MMSDVPNNGMHSIMDTSKEVSWKEMGFQVSDSQWARDMRRDVDRVYSRLRNNIREAIPNVARVR